MKSFFKYFLTITLIVSLPLYADYSKALEFYNQGKNQESLQAIATDLDAQKDMADGSPNYKLRFLAAHNHWKLKNYDSVISHLTKCISMKPQSVDPLIDMGLLYIDIKKYHEAVELGKKIIEREPNNAMGFYVVGKARNELKNYWGGKELIEKALSLDPDLYAGWNELGKSLLNLKKYTDAEIAFSTGLALNSNSAEILNNLSICCFRLGEKSKASSFIKKAVEIAPKNSIISKNSLIINKN